MARTTASKEPARLGRHEPGERQVDHLERHRRIMPTSSQRESSRSAARAEFRAPTRAGTAPTRPQQPPTSDAAAVAATTSTARRSHDVIVAVTLRRQCGWQSSDQLRYPFRPTDPSVFGPTPPPAP